MWKYVNIDLRLKNTFFLQAPLIFYRNALDYFRILHTRQNASYFPIPKNKVCICLCEFHLSKLFYLFRHSLFILNYLLSSSFNNSVPTYIFLLSLFHAFAFIKFAVLLCIFSYVHYPPKFLYHTQFISYCSK